MTKKEKRQIGRTPANLTNGGFRAGKRKKGNSLLKKAPKSSAVTIKYAMVDADGNIIGYVDTITTKPE